MNKKIIYLNSRRYSREGIEKVEKLFPNIEKKVVDLENIEEYKKLDFKKDEQSIFFIGPNWIHFLSLGNILEFGKKSGGTLITNIIDYYPDCFDAEEEQAKNWTWARALSTYKEVNKINIYYCDKDFSSNIKLPNKVNIFFYGPTNEHLVLLKEHKSRDNKNCVSIDLNFLFLREDVSKDLNLNEKPQQFENLKELVKLADYVDFYFSCPYFKKDFYKIPIQYNFIKYLLE